MLWQCGLSKQGYQALVVQFRFAASLEIRVQDKLVGKPTANNIAR